ncbi:MAG: hypothetical protein ABW220_12860 [Burkholderiaceae bacterium]
MNDDSFAPPPFKPDAALATLKRHLRDMRLLDRAGRFEWKGNPMVEVTLDGAVIVAKSVKRPARTPEWQTRRLANAAEVRRWTEDFKRQFSGWTADDD